MQTDQGQGGCEHSVRGMGHYRVGVGGGGRLRVGVEGVVREAGVVVEGVQGGRGQVGVGHLAVDRHRGTTATEGEKALQGLYEQRQFYHY